jgi:hypothetical protein
MLATRNHWRKAAFSDEEWYKGKYGGFISRVNALRHFLLHAVADFIWGHGEKPLRVMRTILLVLGATSLFTVLFTQHANSVSDFVWRIVSTFADISLIFVGVNSANVASYNDWIKAFLTLGRYVSLAFLVGVITKRISRR